MQILFEADASNNINEESISTSVIFFALCNFLPIIAYMGAYTVGEALNLVMEKNGWKPKLASIRIHEEWEQIVGKTISKYTRTLYLSNKTLTLYTDVGPLKQELLLGKAQLIERINTYLGDKVVEEIMIK